MDFIVNILDEVNIWIIGLICFINISVKVGMCKLFCFCLNFELVVV